jgi:hypothetical protein
MNYIVCLINGEKIATFTSEWKFKENEQIFIHSEDGKKNFVIKHITHDLTLNNEHVIRLYGHEKKVY